VTNLNFVCVDTCRHLETTWTLGTTSLLTLCATEVKWALVSCTFCTVFHNLGLFLLNSHTLCFLLWSFWLPQCEFVECVWIIKSLIVVYIEALVSTVYMQVCSSPHPSWRMIKSKAMCLTLKGCTRTKRCFGLLCWLRKTLLIKLVGLFSTYVIVWTLDTKIGLKSSTIYCQY